MEVGRAPRVREFHALERVVGRAPWHAYAGRRAPVRVRATSLRSALYHEGAIEERVGDAITARLRGLSRSGAVRPGRGPSTAQEDGGDGAPLDVLVRVTDDEVSLLVDVAGRGAPLHMRGWRAATTSTCMRETAAAACVAHVSARIAADAAAGRGGGGDAHDATEWCRHGVWDAFCGSGTLLLEAADAAGLRGAGRPLPRTFAFEAWPIHDRAKYAAFLEVTGSRRPRGAGSRA